MQRLGKGGYRGVPKTGVLRGDFGVTFGTPSGDDTALRLDWNNQNTGLVNDEVFELRLEPNRWGELEVAP